MTNIISNIMSFIFRAVPDILYFTCFIIYTYKIKNKRKILFFLIGVSYILLIMMIRHQIIYYIAFILSIYCILKLLYKNMIQKIDIFVISLSSVYLTIISCICSIFINQSIIIYYSLLLINKLLLFLPFLFREKFNILYEKYRKLWNRNDKEKRFIKSITLRNVSLISVNLFILLLNITIVNILSFR